jgi:hypothetical protein
MGEEFGTASKNLPPTKLVLIILGVVLVIVAIVAFMLRPKSSAAGSIDAVESVELAGQNSVLVAINISLQSGERASFKMRSITATLDTGTETHEDEPASAVDFDRYFQAFPALKQRALAPLKIQTIEPGGQKQGTIIVSFPVTAAGFASKKSLKVTVQAYGEPAPLVLTAN